MATPDQVGSPFRAAGAMPVDRRFGGRISANNELAIHALGNSYTVEGNGTVASLPALPIGEILFLRIAGTPTFTNSTKLICPSGVSYVATSGDLVIARSTGDGVWQLYVVPNSQLVQASGNLSELSAKYTAKDNISVHGSDIASAGTLNLETAIGDLVDVTGTTTITAITLSDGHERTVRFTSSLTLTNGASLVLPGGANIITAAGDFAVFRGYAAGVVRAVSYHPAAGVLGLGLQPLSATQQQQARANVGVADRNLLVNGGFRFNPRGYVSGAALTVGMYGHTQWKCSLGGSYTFAQLGTDTQITLSAGLRLTQVIDPRKVSVGGSYVVSWTGGAVGRVGVNSATPSGSFVASPIVVTGQTANTVMSVEFGNGGSGTFGTVKVEAGSIATPYESCDFLVEQLKCEWYCRSVVVSASGYFLSGTSVLMSMPWAMRAAPSLASQATNVDFANTNVTSPFQTMRPDGGFFAYSYSGGAAGLGQFSDRYLLSAEL